MCGRPLVRLRAQPVALGPQTVRLQKWLLLYLAAKQAARTVVVVKPRRPNARPASRPTADVVPVGHIVGLLLFVALPRPPCGPLKLGASVVTFLAAALPAMRRPDTDRRPPSRPRPFISPGRRASKQQFETKLPSAALAVVTIIPPSPRPHDVRHTAALAA